MNSRYYLRRGFASAALILGALVIVVFLVVLYSGYGKGLERFGLVGQKKQDEQQSLAAPGNGNLPHSDTVIDGGVDALSTTATATKYGYPWRGNAPITITITDHTSPSWRPLVEKAAADWSLSPVIDVKLTASDGVCSDKAKATVCDGHYGGLASWGWTYQTVSRSGYMTDGAVYMDDSWLDSATADQRQHIICHEMGHALGLSHPICDDSNGTWFTTPTQANYDALVAIYSGSK